jgi:hypothetical protein
VRPTAQLGLMNPPATSVSVSAWMRECIWCIYNHMYIYMYIYIYIMHVVVIHNLLVVWNLFFHILGIIIPTGFHIFQRVENHQPDNIGYTGHPWLSMDIIFFKPPYFVASSPKPGALSDEVFIGGWTHGICCIKKRGLTGWLKYRKEAVEPDTLWWTNIAMENHHFSWVNPL